MPRIVWKLCNWAVGRVFLLSFIYFVSVILLLLVEILEGPEGGVVFPFPSPNFD